MPCNFPFQPCARAPCSTSSCPAQVKCQLPSGEMAVFIVHLFYGQTIGTGSETLTYRYDADGNLTDAKLIQQVAAQMQALAAWTRQ